MRGRTISAKGHRKRLWDQRVSVQPPVEDGAQRQIQDLIQDLIQNLLRRVPRPELSAAALGCSLSFLLEVVKVFCKKTFPFLRFSLISR